MTEKTPEKPEAPKGKNGGPRPGSGRKPGGMWKIHRELRELITPEDVKAALVTLKAAARGGDVDAAKYLIDQVHGKPRQVTQISGLNNEPIQVTVKHVGSPT